MQYTLKQLQSDQLLGIKSLKLQEDLKEVPSEIFLLADSLEILDLNNNQLDSLPDDFYQLQNLKILFLSNNNFAVLPKILAKCPKLEMIGFKSNKIIEVPKESLPPMTRWLILTDNKIERLPEDIGSLHRLQKLMLAGNKLKDLPSSLSDCKALELVRVSANNLASFPEALMSLPRLTWLAFNGNPFVESADHGDSEPDVLRISFDDLILKNILGEGASGTTYQAEWPDNPYGLAEDFAVKIFKKGITSDGYAADELRICLSVGAHKNLTKTMALAEDKSRQAIVMKLIPANFYNLAGPPSLASCTRDTFAEGFSLSLDRIQLIVDQMLDVKAYLQKFEIYHGDLYAHNVLYNEQGEMVLGDFGAAGSYAMLQDHEKNKIVEIEDRAVGVFIEDLLSVCSVEDRDSEDFSGLKSLAANLMN